MKGLFKKKTNNQNEEDIKIITSYCKELHYALYTVRFNCKVVDMILSDTIKNEEGEKTCTMKFEDIKSLAVYLKSMNNLTIEFLENKFKEVSNGN